MKRLFILPALLCACVTDSYAYEPRAMYSTDQLFDNSLEELREAMRQAKQDNEEIKAQNRALKETVAELEESVVDNGGDTAAAEVPAADSLSDDALVAKEKKLYESRLENSSLRLSRVTGQKERLEKNINMYANENDETKQQIAALKKDVSDIELALNASGKPQVAKSNSKSVSLTKQLAAKKEQISMLEKKLAMQKAAMKDKLAQKEKYASNNSALEEYLSSGKDELARVKSGERLLGRSAKVRTLDHSVEKEAMARQDLSALQNYRDNLRESVADLKKASASVKSSQTDGLEKILKVYKDQQALLQLKMEAVEPGSSLAARKESLLSEQIRLEGQIAAAQKGVEPGDAKAALAASAVRVNGLKTKISGARNSSPLQKQNQDLSTQLAVLQQDLQNLRDNPQGDFAKDPQEVKLEIAQLEARRAALANSVQNIYEKFNLNELPTQDLAAKEGQLKEYFETLRLENTALQQKLLTLQMRQERNVNSIQ